MVEPLVIDTASMDWQPSPSPGVERKRLELDGPLEAGRVTSVVRYAAGSQFHSHPHPDGEEILVLEGVFTDERGDHPAGTFMLNPEGYEHAPSSRDGCVLFVKLRQYPGTERSQIRIDTLTAPWESLDGGAARQTLYSEPSHPESIHLLRFEPNTSTGPLDLAAHEVFVVSGSFNDGDGERSAGTWLKRPGGLHTLQSAAGCLLYLKSGHLADSP